MKHPKLQIMIDHLKNLDNSETSEMGFDMNYGQRERDATQHPCGSACCIGGHAAVLLKKEKMEISDALQELCDIPHETAYKICWPPAHDEKNHYEAPLEVAIAVLEHCRDTGEVMWNEIDK